jgi:hypothetical protein
VHLCGTQNCCVAYACRYAALDAWLSRELNISISFIPEARLDGVNPRCVACLCGASVCQGCVLSQPAHGRTSNSKHDVQTASMMLKGQKKCSYYCDFNVNRFHSVLILSALQPRLVAVEYTSAQSNRMCQSPCASETRDTAPAYQMMQTMRAQMRPA